MGFAESDLLKTWLLLLRVLEWERVPSALTRPPHRANACTMPSAWRCPHLAQDCPWRRRCPRCCCDRSGELRWRGCYLQNCEGENARCLANPAARAGEERHGPEGWDTWGQSDPYCV